MREFRDPHGINWTVWEVIPASVERRRLRNRRVARRRDAGERRQRHEPQLLPSRGRVAGWLVFESRHAKFRLRPIPTDWDTSSDGELQTLLEQATAAPPPRRLLD